LALVAEATRFIGTQPVGGGTLTLTDVTNIVSNSSLHRAAISMVALFSRRKLEVCDSRTQALNWLATQG
jgi:hypothetical protein